MFGGLPASTVRGFGLLVMMTLWAEPAFGVALTQEMSGYTWLVVYASVFAFVAAYGIGANDVANSFATSVGAKSITMKQAVVLACIFEFSGAVLLGSSVAETMRKGIADEECFEENPQLLMWGMTCVIQSVGFWLILASYLELPVSTTHSAVGAIIGMTIMARSSDCVHWYEKTDEFPFMEGVAAIAFSWVLSPVASGFMSALLYFVTWASVLRWESDTAFRNAKILFPVVVGFTVGVNIVFILLKGVGNKSEELGIADWISEAKDGNPAKVCIAAAVGAAIALIGTAFAMPQLGARAEAAALEAAKPAENPLAPPSQKKAARKGDPAKGISLDPAVEVVEVVSEESGGGGFFGGMSKYVTSELKADPLKVLASDAQVEGMHSNLTRHEARVEELFKYVQVFTAIVNSFSHGANDVANAMGPFAAVYMIYKNGDVASKVDGGSDMYWILALGGAGIGLGLATYGYKIMICIGVKLVAVTPSRGFCIELGAAFVVLYGTIMGWPLSTTHCIVGATVGVGLFEGAGGINGGVLLRCVVGWVATLLVAGCTAAMLVGPSPEPIKAAYCDDA